MNSDKFAWKRQHGCLMSCLKNPERVESWLPEHIPDIITFPCKICWSLPRPYQRKPSLGGMLVDWMFYLTNLLVTVEFSFSYQVAVKFLVSHQYRTRVRTLSTIPFLQLFYSVLLTWIYFLRPSRIRLEKLLPAVLQNDFHRIINRNTLSDTP